VHTSNKTESKKVAVSVHWQHGSEEEGSVSVQRITRENKKKKAMSVHRHQQKE